jgi:hypothetical protein
MLLRAGIGEAVAQVERGRVAAALAEAVERSNRPHAASIGTTVAVSSARKRSSTAEASTTEVLPIRASPSTARTAQSARRSPAVLSEACGEAGGIALAREHGDDRGGVEEHQGSQDNASKNALSAGNSPG